MTTVVRKPREVVWDFFAGATIAVILVVTVVAVGGWMQLAEVQRVNHDLRATLSMLRDSEEAALEEDSASSVSGGWVVVVGTILAALLGVSVTVGSACRARSETQRHRDACSESEDIARTRTRELMEARERLARSEAAKSDFLAVMSHELRTPLNTILGYTHLLLEEATSPQIRRDYLEAVRSGGDALRGVFQEVLDFAAIERGAIKVCMEPVDIRQLVRQVIAAMQPPHRCERLVADIHDAIPSKIWADENKLRQVILNLVANALKFTPHGDVTIRCGMEAAGQRLAVEVIDHGIGMEEEEIPRLFEPFTQAESTTRRRYGGAGLGLAICKRFLEAMGGSIAAKSQPGEGSRFSFWLPLRPALVDDGESTVLTPLSSAFSSMRCLVVDDNRVNRRLVVTLLARLGLEVESAGGGEECLSLFRKSAFDIIFMDLEMPEMDGFDTTMELRRIERSQGAVPVAVFALTGDVVDGIREKCLRAGMNGYLGKPVRPGELVDALYSVRKGGETSPSCATT